jgi:hypothetical protein
MKIISKIIFSISVSLLTILASLFILIGLFGNDQSVKMPLEIAALSLIIFFNLKIWNVISKKILGVAVLAIIILLTIALVL